MIAIRTAKSRARFSRRAFLQRVGASAAVVPLLGTERALGATASGAPKRLITIAWTNGVAQSLFWPAGDDPTSTPILKPLEPWKSKVLVPAGIDIKVMLDAGRKFDGHFSYPSLFTGTYRNLGGQRSDAAGPSLDQVVSDAIAKKVNLPVPLMVVSAAGNPTSYRAAAQRNTAETDTGRMFSRLFQGRTLSTGQVDTLRERRKSVLDYVGKDVEAFSARVGTEDRAKIGAHLQSVRQLELQLAANVGAGCMAPAQQSGADYGAKVKIFNQLAAAAIRCDLTRVVSMVWGGDGGGPPNSFQFMGVGGAYHGLAHQGPAGYGQKVKIDTWLFQQVADLVKQLADTPEAGGTALDNSVIVAANDMNEGNGHNVGGVPFVVIGSGGGYLRTGRVVRLGSWAGRSGNYWSGASGVAHNKLLATIANALDVPMGGFGAAAYTGELNELKA